MNESSLFGSFETCNRTRAWAGLPYPRICIKCGLFGNCAEDVPLPLVKPPTPAEVSGLTPVLDISGLGFTQSEIDCKNGDC